MKLIQAVTDEESEAIEKSIDFFSKNKISEENTRFMYDLLVHFIEIVKKYNSTFENEVYMLEIAQQRWDLPDKQEDYHLHLASIMKQIYS